MTTPQPVDQPHLAHPETPVTWLVRLIKGIAIGIGAILPGLSGGVLAVIFKVYDPLIAFLANIRRNFWRNVAYFIPIGIGVGIGIVLFSIVVEAAFATYAAQFTCLFMGFVIGTFPSLHRQAGKKGRRSLHYAIMAIAAVVIFALMVLGGQALVDVTPSFLAWLGSGALIGLGVIVPGMSPSNFLIYFGLYDTMATGIKNADFGVIVPLALGLIACILAFAKVADWLFTQYYTGMYHAVLGMVIGSTLAIIPTVVLPAYTPQGLADSGLSMGTAVVFAVVMLVVGIVLSLLFSKVEDRVEADAPGAEDVADASAPEQM